MGGLLLLLVPEIVGLMITPGAVVGCVLLLRSKFPVRNASAFGGGFLVVYLLVALSAVLGGASDPGSTPAEVSHSAGLVVGLLFLAGGCWVLLRKPVARRTGRPRLLTELETAGPRKAFAIGLVLGILNPNVFIMLSGMSIVSSASVSIGASLVATLVLLIAAAADFLIPIGAYLIGGERTERGLVAVETWMLRHSRELTLGVLFGFGALFTIRGAVALLG